MKRIIQLLLVFLLLVPVNAHAQKRYTNEYKYKGVIFSYILKDNEAIIIGFNNAAKEVQIPSEIITKKRKDIPRPQSQYKRGLRPVSIFIIGHARQIHPK